MQTRGLAGGALSICHQLTWTQCSCEATQCKTGTLLDLQLVNQDLVKFKNHPNLHSSRRRSVSSIEEIYTQSVQPDTSTTPPQRVITKSQILFYLYSKQTSSNHKFETYDIQIHSSKLQSLENLEAFSHGNQKFWLV